MKHRLILSLFSNKVMKFMQLTQNSHSPIILAVQHKKCNVDSKEVATNK